MGIPCSENPLLQSHTVPASIFTRKNPVYIIIFPLLLVYSLLTTINQPFHLASPKKNSSAWLRKRHVVSRLVFSRGRCPAVHKGLTDPALGARQWTVVKCPVIFLFLDIKGMATWKSSFTYKWIYSCIVIEFCSCIVI